MLIITILIKLVVAFHVHTLEALWEELLWNIRAFIFVLDDWLYNSALLPLDLHTITLVSRCIRERISNLRLQHLHHMSHRTDHAIKTVSFWYSNLPLKQFNHFLYSKFYGSSRVSHIMNDHIEEYFRILKLNFQLFNFLTMIFLKLSNFFLEHVILLLTDIDHLEIVELLKL